jgi:hypothetical protein
MLARHDPVRAVLVVASTYGDRVDDVGVGLATAAAQWGHRVLVIQSYHPDKGRNGDSAVGEVTSRVVIEAASPQTSNGHELMSNDGFDLIVACTPPPGYSPNAMSFVSSTDLAIVVATRGKSKSRDARWAADLLRHTGVRVAGAVLLDRDGRKKRAAPAHLAPLSGANEGAEALPASSEGESGRRSGSPAPAGGPAAWAGPTRRTGAQAEEEVGPKGELGNR